MAFAGYYSPVVRSEARVRYLAPPGLRKLHLEALIAFFLPHFVTSGKLALDFFD